MKIATCDFSLTGSCFFYTENDNIDRYSFTYYSDKKGDTKNDNCIFLSKEMKSEDKLDEIVGFCTYLVYDKDLFIMESPAFNSINSSSCFKDGYGIISYICRRLHVPVLFVPPISLKLYISDNAKALKEDIRQSIIRDYGVDYKEISKYKWDNICDARALYELGKDYIKCDGGLPAPKGLVNTSDIEYFESLPLYKQQVIARLYGREDLCKEISKKRRK